MLNESIITDNYGLLRKLANRYAIACIYDRAVDCDDLIQAGAVGLLIAAESYSPERGKTFAGYAKWFISREMQRALGLREGKPTRADTGAWSLDVPVSADDPDGLTFADTLADDSLPDIDDGVIRDDLRSQVQAAVTALPDVRGRQIVQTCDLSGGTLRNAAEALGISAERARQLRSKALKALKRDKKLQALAWIDDHTRYYAHKSVSAFQRDLTSVTEGAALWRLEQYNNLSAGQ